MLDHMKLSSRNPSRAIWLLSLAIVVSLIFAGSAMTQSKQTKTPSAPVKQAVVPKAKAPGWCNNAAPVVNNVATVTISPSGSSKLKVDYERVCIGSTDKIEWKWSGPENWNVEFFTGANPFPKNKYGKGNPKSDLPKAAPNDYLIYKYKIHVDNHTDLDPDVIIKG